MKDEDVKRFILEADDDELAQVIDALGPRFADKYGTCECGYHAIGNNAEEIVIDLGIHAIQSHAEDRQALNESRRLRGLPPMEWDKVDWEAVRQTFEGEES